MLLVGTATLALGLAGGAAITEIFAKDGSSPTVSIQQNGNSPGSSGTPLSGTAESVAEHLAPAVATIVNQPSTRSSSGAGTSLGSGFVLANTDGLSYLVTNNHVVRGAAVLRVIMPDGTNLPATVVGTDSFDDLAVVSVHAGNLPLAHFGRSSRLRPGQPVVAIGSPLANQGSVTVGVISALHRQITAGSQESSSTEQLQDVLQTDAPINPGNSGGPLADTSGDVVGVNVATESNANGIGFSIPSDIAVKVVDQLIKGQKVTHGFIGIGTEDVINATIDGHPFSGAGVLVTSVQASSPASRAGFQTGDIITAVDGVALENGQTIGGVIQEHAVGDTLHCAVRRGGQTLTIDVTLAARPAGV